MLTLTLTLTQNPNPNTLNLITQDTGWKTINKLNVMYFSDTARG